MTGEQSYEGYSAFGGWIPVGYRERTDMAALKPLILSLPQTDRWAYVFLFNTEVTCNQAERALRQHSATGLLMLRKQLHLSESPVCQESLLLHLSTSQTLTHPGSVWWIYAPIVSPKHL